MIRGFLYGLGTLFAMGVIHALTEPANRYYLMQLNETAVGIFFGLIFAAFIAFFVAMFLPPGRSWGRALLGGALGFFGPIIALIILMVVSTSMSMVAARLSPPSQTPTPPCSGIDCR